LSPRLITKEIAHSVAESKHVGPLEDFTGDTTAPWRVQCKVCLKALSLSYRALSNAKKIGCRDCSIADKAKKRAFSTTTKSLMLAGWEMLTPLEEYTTQFSKVRARHTKCGTEVHDAPHLLKLKLCECEHAEKAYQRRAKGESVANARNGSLLDTWYEDSRQWGRWACQKGHIWKTHWYSVVGKQKTWCPFCSGRQAITGVNDLANVNPVLAETFDLAKNSPLCPEELLPNSNLKVWWICSKGHSFDATVSNRHLLGTACPFCSNHKVLSGFNDLLFLDKDVARYWHPTKNDLLPDEVTRTSNKKVWWLCELQHETHSHISTKVLGRGACSTCSGKTLQKGFNDLASVRPEIASLWHPTKNGELSPSDITQFSNQRVWWLCELGHDWKKDVNGRSQGRGCPFCAYKKCWSGFNDMATTHPHLLDEWDFGKNELDPTKIIAGGKHLAFWTCDKHGSYKATTLNRAFGLESGCPNCSESGYRPYYRGLLYFIENKKLGARKIGITNTHKNRRRLEAFEAAGWGIISIWEHDEGIVAKMTERVLLKTWIRQELQMPAFLERFQMASLNGQSETFSEFGPSNEEICRKGDLLFGKFRELAERDMESLTAVDN
jgi:hypothetical protein